MTAGEEATTSGLTPRVTVSPRIQRCRNPTQPVARVPSSLNQFPEQTLGTGSPPIPTTPREVQLPGGLIRIRGEEATTTAPTPRETGTPGIQGLRNPAWPVAWVPSRLILHPEQTWGSTSAPTPRTPGGSPTTRCSETPRIRGSQDHRITGSYRNLDSKEIKHNQEH